MTVASRLRSTGVILAVGGTVAALLALTMREGGTAGAQGLGRVASKPDLNGVWQAMTSANWDIQDHPAAPGPYGHLLGAYFAQPAGRGIVVGNEIPYQPWELAQKKKIYDTRLEMDTTNL